MTHELKQASDEAIRTITAHLGDSHHITRFHVPAIADYIAYLEGQTPSVAEPEVTADAPADFDVMTVSQLRDYAAAHDVDLTGLTLKADIIAALQQHSEAENN